jgi:Mg/Co/Ni transporter MgtE (contains CBS domain)
MSAPFITTATDVAGVFIYLRTAAWLLERLPAIAPPLAS